MAQRTFRVLVGSHYEGEKEYSAKDPKTNIVHSHRNLCEVFPNKFEEVHLAPAPVAVAPTPAPQGKNAPNAAVSAQNSGSATAGTASTAAKDAVSELGEDASGDFDEALAAELKVFRKGKNYFVTQPDELNKALNDEPLKLKDVGPFINKLLGK